MEVSTGKTQSLSGASGYPAIDIFRMVAAFLVVAVHTSPLLSVSDMGDFVFTRVLARVAVPFFFMASGFFLQKKLAGGARPGAALGGFAKKIALLYGVSILLYLPLNIYMGYFAEPGLAVRLARDIFFDGTLYHLWYFPAVLLGGALAVWLYRHLHPGVAFAIAGLLYAIGLGGDSYYGLVAQVPAFRSMYDGLFVLFDYTRNGLFFAPLFVMLGMRMAARPARQPGTRGAVPYATALAGGLCLMLAEALLLRRVGSMRHDSMYLLLPVVMWGLFGLLQRVRGAGRPRLRKLSTLIFILHPWCIVGVRGVAKLLKIDDIVLGSSPLFYLCVCVASLILALLLAAVPPFWKGGRKKPGRRAWAEMDEAALVHNLAEVRRLLPTGAQVMAVVKADAYGHGAVPVARCLQRSGVRAFAVATLDEGAALRRRGIRGEILVLGYTPPEQARRLWFYRLTQTVVDVPHAEALSRQGLPLRVHIKVDTGMHRLGVPVEAVGEICRLYRLPHLRVGGIYTHLARADSRLPADEAFTTRQCDAWYGLLAALEARGTTPGKTHLQSSHGLLNHPGLPCHYARIGLALYGAVGDAAPTKARADLRPVLALKARVASVRAVPAGQWVGYGDGHRCPADTRVATLTIGYADGIPRSLQGGRVLVRGVALPIIGRICMDQLLVDATALPGLQPGEVATLLGGDGGSAITAGELADKCGTIPNEILARLGGRVARCRVGAGSRQAEAETPVETSDRKADVAPPEGFTAVGTGALRLPRWVAARQMHSRTHL